MSYYYRLVISYDGTAYAGWQSQRDALAVANILEKRFLHVFKKNVRLVGASRTDAGVHALYQVARIKTDLFIDPAIMMRAWNNKLPSDIIIRAIDQVDESFHPQRNVLGKTYWYHFFPERPLPFLARYGYSINKAPLEQEKLEHVLKIFVGKHDFRSFCTGNDHLSTTRSIDEITLHFFKRFNMYRIEVQGAGFLRYMIRRIVGASVYAACHKGISCEFIQTILEAKNPHHTLPNAPAHGLVLAHINYKKKS